MDDIFQRKKRRHPFIRLGGIFFALLAIASVVDAIRASPLSWGGGVEATGLEALLYRLAAALIAGALAIWLLLPHRDRHERSDSLLR